VEGTHGPFHGGAHEAEAVEVALEDGARCWRASDTARQAELVVVLDRRCLGYRSARRNVRVSLLRTIAPASLADAEKARPTSVRPRDQAGEA
jgi:hypothetical protein